MWNPGVLRWPSNFKKPFSYLLLALEINVNVPVNVNVTKRYKKI